MAKAKTQFSCSACGNITSKWSGRCEACGEWNTIQEEAPLSAGPSSKSLGRAKGRTVPLSDLSSKETPPPRTASGLSELDRVLGGGLVPFVTCLLGLVG